jgi:hypothetical protein
MHQEGVAVLSDTLVSASFPLFLHLWALALARLNYSTTLLYM